MRETHWILLAALLAAGSCSTKVEDEGAVETGPEARPVAVVAFTEGPTVDAEGNVYFTEIRTARIMKFTPGKGLSAFRENSNRANGLIFDDQWRLIACEGGEKPRITRTDMKTGEIEVLANSFEGAPFNGPNDVTIDGKGRIYFTDLPGAAIYRLDTDGKLARILAAPDIERPNGIVISPDDATLYQVESNGAEGGARMIRAYDLAGNGSLGNMRVHYNFYPGRSADGLAIDTEGNVYAAAGLNRLRGSSETLDTKPGIHVISPDGKLVGYYPIYEDTITNCAFGGEDMKTLYVTAGKTLLAIRTEVEGTRR